MNKYLMYADDFFLLVGCGCIIFGCAQWNTILAWIVGGIMLIGLSFLTGNMLAKLKAEDTDVTNKSAEQ